MDSVPPLKRGPMSLLPDGDLLIIILNVVTDPPLMGEAYKKDHARLNTLNHHIQEIPGSSALGVLSSFFCFPSVTKPVWPPPGSLVA